MLGSIDLKDWKRDQQRKIDSDDQCSIFKHVEHERDISCCASIEKNLINSPISSPPNEKQLWGSLQNDGILKQKALRTAEQMIQLLREENLEQLEKIKRLNKTIMQQQYRLMSYKEEIERLIKRTTNKKGKTAEFIDQREARVQTLKFGEQGLQQTPKHRQYQQIINKQYSNCRFTSHATRKLAPYSYHSQQCQSMSLFETLSKQLSKEQILNKQSEDDKLWKIVKQQAESLKYLLQGLSERRTSSAEIFSLPIEIDTFKMIAIKQEQSLRMAQIKELIEDYQRCILRYQQYSAHLRGSLCVCINFINEIGVLDQQVMDESSVKNEYCHTQKLETLPSMLRMTHETIVNKVRRRIDMVEEQNTELRSIVEQLIKISKKKSSL